MSLQYHQTIVTPFEVAALHNLIAQADEGQDKDTAYRWLCYARSGLFAEWQALPNGHHLKDAYANEVWAWDDQDLASIPKENQVSPEAVRALFDRPSPEEIEEVITSEFPELGNE